ncbi:MAG: universal stress protein [Magnetococcus sp. WYHC-3]
MKPCRHVLCAVDLDSRSEWVLRRAVQLSRDCDAELLAMAVVDFHSGCESDHYPFQSPSTLRREMVDFMDQNLGVMLERVGAGWVKRRVVTGVPGQAVREEAKNWDAQVVVVGSHAPHGLVTGGLGRWLGTAPAPAFDVLLVKVPGRMRALPAWCSVPSVVHSGTCQGQVLRSGRCGG